MAPREMGSPIPRSAVSRGATLKVVCMSCLLQTGRTSGGFCPGGGRRVVLEIASPGVLGGGVVPLALRPQTLDRVGPLHLEPVFAALLLRVRANGLFSG